MKKYKTPLVRQYERNRDEISLERRQEILATMRRQFALTAERVSVVLNIKPQTVRCWFSDSNPRNISTEHLKTLCLFFGKDPFEDFD